MERKDLKKMKSLVFFRYARLVMLLSATLLMFLLVLGLIPLLFFTGFLILFIPVYTIKEKLEISWRDLLWRMEKNLFEKEIEIIKLENIISKDEEKVFGNKNGDPDSINKITKGLKENYAEVKRAYQKEASILRELMEVWKLAKKKRIKFPGLKGRWNSIKDVERRHLIALIKFKKVMKIERRIKEKELKVVV